jgi:hypothetical protein
VKSIPANTFSLIPTLPSNYNPFKFLPPLNVTPNSNSTKILSSGIGIPRINLYGFECDYSVMFMELLGKSIEDLFTAGQRQFSLKTFLILADQMLTRVE